ncbi:alpha/beta fold hydrolase [Hydrogenophaga laconesensis]|uniref:2-hydroxymuconate-semialdehyde hydrolase n=1 Tax=Hydrogenophaga laconesensis TaxID=1805971 RepID=A0ABU1V7U2_9BURK|nr:alpha/beta fold hydrolase [Hydrogenophaga laconesensis]MDR7093529.1 2-hydroxymuconate-semialdehyde hydrolase [Hydrogenophaga laconesensis]
MTSALPSRTETWAFEAGEFAVHIYGGGPPLLLVHGIGPGTSIRANFSAVLPALAAQRTVYGIDLIGFGASPRKQAPPLFDFDLWVKQARAAVSRIGATELAVWGQSLGAAVALSVAAEEPSVTTVIGTGAGGGAQELNETLDRFWASPATPEAMRRAMEGAVYAPGLLSDAQIEDRFGRLSAEGLGPYFDAMMASGKQAHLQSCWLSPDVLQRVRARVLLIHGRDDRPVPYRESALHLLDHLQDARLMLLSRCGHNPMLERTDDVLALALAHLPTRQATPCNT